MNQKFIQTMCKDRKIKLEIVLVVEEFKARVKYLTNPVTSAVSNKDRNDK